MAFPDIPEPDGLLPMSPEPAPPAAKQPRKRFVGKRTATELHQQQASPGIEDGDSIQRT